MPEYTIRIGEPLVGHFDVEAEAREMPASFILKGMFFTRVVELLGDDWHEVQKRLQAPPRGGRYLAFKDYPQADYTRISGAVAGKLYPEVGLREAVRRLSRDDFDVFGSSTFGRVLLAMVGDARSALHKTPAAYTKMAPGDWKITATDLDARTVRFDWEGLYGSWVYQVGQLEGIVLHYGEEPSITVVELGPHRVRMDVRHRN